MSILLGSTLKVASCVGVAGVSVVSVPITLSVVGSSARSKSLFTPLNEGVNRVKSLSEKSMAGLDGKLKGEYSQFGERVKNDYEGYLSNNLNVLVGGVKSVETSGEFLKKNGEEINYYLFELGGVVKELMKNIPAVIKDSALEFIPGSQNRNLLSFQKISDIVKSKNITKFLTGIMKAVDQHKSLISQLSSKDAQGVLQIFKELPRKQIDDFLKEVETNESKLDKDSSSYCNATKLILHLLVGKDKIDGIKNMIESLKTKISEMKDAITKIEGIGGEIVEQLEQQLGEISSNKTIQDPCAQ